MYNKVSCMPLTFSWNDLLSLLCEQLNQRKVCYTVCEDKPKRNWPQRVQYIYLTQVGLYSQAEWNGHRRQLCHRDDARCWFHLEEQEQWDGPQGLLPIWSLQYSITVKLNLRMTDAANQRRVSEVKLRFICWPFSWLRPFREPIIRAINRD